jgi:RNA polymerase sigma-70 factor, ECF subfamily
MPGLESRCSPAVITNRVTEHHANVTEASPVLEGPPTMPDAAEIPRARVAALVSEHFNFVWRLLRRLGIPRDEADDAAQQVFMIACRRLDDIEPGREQAFLHGTAIRVAANLRRALGRREHADADLHALEARGIAPDRGAELGQACDLLDQVLARLPDELRTLIVLVEIEELEVAEAARLEGIPAGTAASRLRRARARFRAALQELGERHPFAATREHEP